MRVVLAAGLAGLVGCASGPAESAGGEANGAADERSEQEEADSDPQDPATEDDDPDDDQQAEGADEVAFDAEPVDEATAEQAREIRRDDDQRQHAVDGTTPDSRDDLEQFLAATEPTYEAALDSSTVHSNDNRPEIDVVVVDTFTTGGDDPDWPLLEACPAYVDDPALTGIAWHIDLDEEALVYYAPVREDNIC